jgi:uncharacterized membrane protein
MESLQALLTDADRVFPILNHWLHLLSAVVWIGGLAFIVLALTPALQSAVPRELVKPVVDAVYGRYRLLVGIVLVIILFTGGINLHYINKMMKAQSLLLAPDIEPVGVMHHAQYLIILMIKLTLVVGVMSVYLYTVIFRTEATGEESAEEREEQLREPVPYQRATLIMGAFIILCAAALKYLHQ